MSIVLPVSLIQHWVPIDGSLQVSMDDPTKRWTPDQGLDVTSRQYSGKIERYSFTLRLDAAGWNALNDFFLTTCEGGSESFQAPDVAYPGTSATFKWSGAPQRSQLGASLFRWRVEIALQKRTS